MLAIAAVALLFIIGLTFLVVSGQQRETAMQSAEAHNFLAIDDALKLNAMLQLQRDSVGNNRVPYDGR
jgi:hypothetical protein